MAEKARKPESGNTIKILGAASIPLTLILSGGMTWTLPMVLKGIRDEMARYEAAQTRVLHFPMANWPRTANA